MHDEDNIWAKPTEKRLRNIRSRLSSANPFERSKGLISLRFYRRFAYTFFGLSGLFMFLYYTDPTIFFSLADAKSDKKPSTRMLLSVGNEKPKNSYIRVVTASPYSVNIVDADTIDMGNDRIRLNGISADERGKPTYNSCKREVSSIIRKSSKVICYISGEMTYNREVGECFVVNNGVQEDLNRLIVESGCARDCRRYSGGYYKKFETKVSKQLDLPNYCR